MPRDVALLDDGDGLEGHCGTHRVPRVGESMAEAAVFPACPYQCIVDLPGDDGGRHREIRRCDPLCQRQNVRLDGIGLRTEQASCPAEAADHLVDDQQDVVTAKDLPDLREIPLGGQDHAADPHDRLCDERGDGIRSMIQDLGLQLACEAVRKRLFGLPVPGLPEEAWQVGGNHFFEVRIQVLVHVRHSAQACGENRGSVVGAAPGHDLALGGLAQGLVIAPGHLDGRLVGLGPRAGEKHLLQRPRGDLDQLLRQLDQLVVAASPEGMAVGQVLQLPPGGVHQALFAIAQIGAPQAGHGVQVLPPLGIHQVDALAMFDHQGILLQVPVQIGKRMQMRGTVPGAVVACAVVHGRFRKIAVGSRQGLSRFRRAPSRARSPRCGRGIPPAAGGTSGHVRWWPLRPP